MPSLDPISYAGVLNVTDPSHPTSEIFEEVVMDDLDGEQESFSNLTGQVEEGNNHEGNSNMSELLSVVESASKGVAEGTHEEYMRSVAPSGP